MTGTAPTPNVTGVAESYLRGDPVSFTVRVADPDNRVEVEDTTGPAEDGTTVHVHEERVYVDEATVSAAWSAPTSAPPPEVTRTGPNEWTIATTAPSATATIAVLVVDTQGHPVPVDVPIVVMVPALTMRIGVDCAPGDRRTHLGTGALFAGAAFTRVFFSGLPGTWASPEMGNIPADCEPWVSYKTHDDPALRGLLDSLPAGRTMVVVPHHEPENDMTATAYRALVRQCLAVVNAHRNRDRVQVWSVLMLYQQRVVLKGQHVAEWIEPGIDGVGWDCYSDKGLTHAEPAAEVLALPVATFKANGIPWGVTELGEFRETGQARATFITDAVAICDGNGARVLAWWCAQGTKQADGSRPNFHLDSDQPALTAYQAALAAHS